ncbi:hypothetical protein [Ruegeria atlantica]|uniref:hypothetical protein n=1 Tax=Ruegeria atlantica TaxID=81569 RepID=UPI00147B35EB|nr:hypothetical protein [Ruegeria atlantica]
MDWLSCHELERAVVKDIFSAYFAEKQPDAPVQFATDDASARHVTEIGSLHDCLQ